MKLFIAALMLTNLSLSFATTIECTSSQTGNTYIANEEEGSFKLVESSKKLKYNIGSLVVRKQLVSSTPSEVVTTFSYADREQVVFEVVESEGRLIGEFENDKSLSCEYKN